MPDPRSGTRDTEEMRGICVVIISNEFNYLNER